MGNDWMISLLFELVSLSSTDCLCNVPLWRVLDQDTYIRSYMYD